MFPRDFNLVCIPAQSSKAAGGQKLRWSDIVDKDLKQCGLVKTWQDRAKNREEWRITYHKMGCKLKIIRMVEKNEKIRGKCSKKNHRYR